MLSEFVKRRFKENTAGYWIWAAFASVACCTAIFLLARIFFAGNAPILLAQSAGQRVTVHLDSGEVEGLVRHTVHARKAGKENNVTMASKEHLALAPFASIAEQSSSGLIPIIGHDGTIPWKYYARPFTAPQKRPLVAIIFTHLGLSKPLTESVLDLPHNFTLSFSPYASDSAAWAKKARETGFESLVDLPMEANDYPLSDPGPYGLLQDLDIGESSARLHWVMSRFTGYVGMLAPENEKLTSNINAIRPTLIELAARGMLFFYVKTPQNAAISDLAHSRSLMALGIDTVVDSDISASAIDKQLDSLVALAKTQGYAIGLAHSYPVTTDALSRWSENLASQGVDLAPVSAIAQRVFP